MLDAAASTSIFEQQLYQEGCEILTAERRNSVFREAKPSMTDCTIVANPYGHYCKYQCCPLEPYALLAEKHCTGVS